MLRKLRLKLTVLCTIGTCIILAVMAAICLAISENQLSDRNLTAFQSNLNSIVYRLQTSRIIDNSWLSQMEAGNRLIIHIEDKGMPIFFPGSWSPKTDRNTLITEAYDVALTRFGFDIKAAPLSSIDQNSVTFSLTGSFGDRYQAGAAVVPSYGGWQGIILLHDMSQEDSNITNQRGMFVLLVILSTLILSAFSWWFAGRAIGPVEASAQRQTEFIHAASHELRTPLAVIQTSASAMETDTLTPQSSRFAETIRTECTRMARLVDDLLLLAGADSGTWTLYREMAEPETIITLAFESFEHSAHLKNQHLSLTLPDEPLPLLSCDSQRIQQVLAILIDNALFYTQDGGSIHLSASEHNKHLRMQVSDNGPGISDDNKEKIFRRFYRADASRSKKEHYGLGLSIASEIVRLHCGQIYVTDTPGGGSTFVIELPLS